MSHELRISDGGRPLPGPFDLPRGVRAAMLESRQRWRDFALLDNDLLFETDAEDRFSFVAPAVVLGHASEVLLGTPAAGLHGGPGLSPFMLRRPLRNHLATLRDAEGQLRLLRLSQAPLYDETGRFAGLRGTGRDVTEAEASSAEAAALARRHTILRSLIERGRRDAGRGDAPDRALRRLGRTLGCAGGALLGSWSRRRPNPRLLAGTWPEQGLLAGLPSFPRALLTTRIGALPLIVVPQRWRALGSMAMVFWREAGMRDFDADDIAAFSLFSETMAGLVMQRRLLDHARKETTTSCLDRGAFLAALRRRIDRRHRHGLLVHVDVGSIAPTGEAEGQGGGDGMIRAVAAVLAAKAQPTDLVGRIGERSFAIWCEDLEAEAAEDFVALLAVTLRRHVAAPSCSIGAALVPTSVSTTLGATMARADAALRAAAGSEHRICRLVKA